MSDALTPGAVMPVTVAGTELAVWREQSGGVHAWPDRCPHRGMRLSFGFVRDDRLACMYHGWQYAGNGQCAYIPAQPEFKPGEKVRVDAFNCRDAHGLIWVSLTGDEANSLPSLSQWDGAEVPIRTLHVNAPLWKINEFLDHSAFPPFTLCPQNDARPGPRHDETAAWRVAGHVLGSVDYQRTMSQHGIYVISAHSDSSDEHLIVAMQPVGDDKTALHVLVRCNVGADETSELRSHYHRWLQRLRWAIEHTTAHPTDTWIPYHA